MQFCSPFDEALARTGPGAAFLFDPEGMLRFDANWTRTAWTHADPDPAPLQGAGPSWTWALVRDRGSGSVALVLLTHGALLASHPKGDVRRFADLDAALAARDAYGRPPVCREPWC